MTKKRNRKQKPKSTMGALMEWFFAVFWAFLIAWILHTFLFEINVIPSTSMDRSLHEGDYIVVSKVNYGPRLPFTPVAFPFAHKEMPFFGGKAYNDSILWNYRRLPAIFNVKRNDVVVFNYPKEKGPIDRKEYIVKRCVAAAGDTLQSINGRLLVNDDVLELPHEMQHSYYILSPNKRLGKEWMQKWHIQEGGRRNADGLYQFMMPAYIADSIVQDSFIVHIERANLDKGVLIENETVFPHDLENYPWNTDNFGPIYIPKQGDTVDLNKKTLPFYKKIIEEYEEHELTFKGDSIFVDGVLSDEYVFAMDYYFGMGDNRRLSSDSRVWGFIPENHLIGKVVLLAFSVKPGHKWYHKKAIRWDRVLRWVR